MFITLLDNLRAICAEDYHSKHIWLQHLECQEVVDSQIVAHCKCCPSIVDRRRPIVVDDADPRVAASVGLQQDLLMEVS